MKIKLSVKPNSKKSEIINVDGVITAYLKSAAINNKANIELIKLLAKHYKVTQSSIIIKHGSTSHQKLIEINV